MDARTLFPQSRLLLSAGTLPKARFIERVDAAQKAGFDAIALQELTAALVRVYERASSHGLRVDLEFLPWTLVPDLHTALQVLNDAEQENLGITLDFWHFFGAVTRLQYCTV